MRYHFTIDGNRFEHEMEADVSITGGYAGDRTEPPSGPDVEVTEIYMTHKKKKRPLAKGLFEKVETYLIEKCYDSILEDASEAAYEAKADAAEAAMEARRERRDMGDDL